MWMYKCMLIYMVMSSCMSVSICEANTCRRVYLYLIASLIAAIPNENKTLSCRNKYRLTKIFLHRFLFMSKPELITSIKSLSGTAFLSDGLMMVYAIL